MNDNSPRRPVVRGVLIVLLLVSAPIILVALYNAYFFARDWMAGGRYTATALLRIHPVEQTLIEQGERLSPEDYRNFQKTQEMLLKSNTVLMTALGDPNIAKLPTVWEHKPDQVPWLEENLKVHFEGEIMSVSLSGTFKDDLPKIVNEVVDTYIDRMVKGEMSQRAAENEQLKSQLEQRRRRLNTLRAMRNNQQNAAGASTQLLQRQHEQVIDEMGQLKKESFFAHNELKKAEIESTMARLQDHTAVDQARVDKITAGVVDTDPMVIALEAKLADLEEGRQAAAKKLDAGSVDRDPGIQATSDQIRQVRQQLTAVRDDARRDAETRAAAIVGGVDLAEIEHRRMFYESYALHLEGELMTLETKGQVVNVQGNGLAALDDEIAALEDWVKRIEGRVYTLDFELKAPSRIQLIEHAPVPHGPWWR